MKKWLVVLLTLVFAGMALGQDVVTLGITNVRVEGTELKWDVTFRKTDTWPNNQTLGEQTYRFNINHAAMSTADPQLSNINAVFSNYPSPTAAWATSNTIIRVNIGSTGADWQPVLNTTYTLFTVSVQITDGSENAGLAWNSNTAVQNMHSSPDAVERTLSGDSDIPLPVNMSSFAADRLPLQGIKINWTMESQYDAAEFNVLRSGDINSGYARVNTRPLAVQDAALYSFLDTDVTEGAVYFYKIEEVSLSGTSAFYGPVEVMGIDGLPSEITLTQNYPNPFNPGTSIAYTLPERSHVTLTIYNVFGRQVKVLVNEAQDAGYYPVEWDGTDSAGRNVATGVYYSRLQAGDAVHTRKMIKIQ